eukprot:358375-Chlamydomonas_euryale.AAC.10
MWWLACEQERAAIHNGLPSCHKTTHKKPRLPCTQAGAGRGLAMLAMLCNATARMVLFRGGSGADAAGRSLPHGRRRRLQQGRQSTGQLHMLQSHKPPPFSGTACRP